MNSTNITDFIFLSTCTFNSFFVIFLNNVFSDFTVDGIEKSYQCFMFYSQWKTNVKTTVEIYIFLDYLTIPLKCKKNAYGNLSLI